MHKRWLMIGGALGLLLPLLVGAAAAQAQTPPPNVKLFNSAHFALNATFTSGDSPTPTTLKGEGDVTMPDRLQGTFTSGGQTAELIQIGNQTYTRQPGGPWQQSNLDLSQLTGMSGLGGNTTLPQGTDAQQIFSGLFSLGLATIQEAGSETVSGVETTRYQGTIDLGTLLSLVQAQTGQPSNTPPLDFKPSYQLWVGKNDQILRQFKTQGQGTLPSTSGGAPIKISFDISATFSQINQPVTITAPANTVPQQSPRSGGLLIAPLWALPVAGLLALAGFGVQRFSRRA